MLTFLSVSIDMHIKTVNKNFCCLALLILICIEDMFLRTVKPLQMASQVTTRLILLTYAIKYAMFPNALYVEKIF